jgi:hypothetical protein
MSDYTKLKKEGLKRGRPRLPENERQERKQLVLMRAEARRRAMLVICDRHTDELKSQVEVELKELLKQSKKK